MRYCKFESETGPQYGVIEQRDGASWIARSMPPPEEDLQARLAELVSKPSKPFQPLLLSSAKLLMPVTPSKVVCVGRNYRDHVSELGNDLPTEPLVFYRPPSSLVGTEEAIVLSSLSKRMDFEGELALVIGKTCRNIGPDEDVFQYIRGYTCVNDVSARDLQKNDGQWWRAKGMDGTCPVGPVVSDEIDFAAGVRLATRVNGVVKQQGNTRDFIFEVPTLMRFITAALTLNPGDLIPTGTPSGVGPLQPGDVVEVEIDGIGTLRNPVRA